MKVSSRLAGCCRSPFGIFLTAALVLSIAGCGTRSASQQQASSKSISAVLTGKSQAKPSAGAKNDVSAAAASSNAFAFDLLGPSARRTTTLSAPLTACQLCSL